jgi:hypothetical protein
VEVQQVVPGGPGHGVENVPAATLADVHHALEHGPPRLWAASAPAGVR